MKSEFRRPSTLMVSWCLLFLFELTLMKTMMPGFSLEAPPNLRTTLPDRPLSATRGRPGAPSSRSSSVEPGPNVRPRRQSCSPSRGRAPNGISHTSGSSVPAFSRGHSKVNDNVSPVLMGTKMVERVINMRKLAPPKQEDKHSPHGNHSGKSASSPDSSGFGRSLSKKSLDMAIRHMDIRRSIPGNLRPLMTNIPASSMYSVRSGPTRSRTISVSDSPLATSSNASSEVSVNNNGLCLDGSEVEDNGSERGGRSPASVRGSLLYVNISNNRIPRLYDDKWQNQSMKIGVRRRRSRARGTIGVSASFGETLGETRLLRFEVLRLSERAASFDPSISTQVLFFKAVMTPKGLEGSSFQKFKAIS
ncbi:hypothetical protein ACFX1S_041780 [Malus domestica]